MVYDIHDFYVISTLKTNIAVNMSDNYQSFQSVFKPLMKNYIVLLHIGMDKIMFMHDIMCSNLNIRIFDGPGD